MAKAMNRKPLVIILVASLLLNLAAALYGAKKIYDKSKLKAYQPPPARAYYLDRNKVFEALPEDSNSIVFLGDSHIQYFELGEIFKGLNIKNRGIHGDDVEGALKRIGTVINQHPNKVFIELGSNDLDLGFTKERYLGGYKKIIDTLQATCPNAKIYVMDLLPAENSSIYAPSYCSPERNKQTREMNVELKKLAEKEGCIFIEAHKSFLKGDQLDPKYSVDGGHLNGQGYTVWANVLRPYVVEWSSLQKPFKLSAN